MKKGFQLLTMGVAMKHYTYTLTGIIVLFLNNHFVGYVYSGHTYIDIVGSSNSVVDRGNITDNLLNVKGAGKTYIIERKEWE